MASLQDLIASLPGAMQQQILTPEQQQARLQDYLNAANPEILRQYGQTSQQQNEAAFGKGMGLSTWNAYQQALNTLNQNEALNRARVEGQSAIDSAQRAAIGNAANYASNEMGRQQQAQMNRSNQRQATSFQNRNMLYGGLGGLAQGGLATVARDLTRPAGQASSLGSAYDRIKGLFGGGESPAAPNAPDMTNPPPVNYGNAGDMSLANASPTVDYTPPDLSPSFGGGYDFGGFNPQIQIPDFSLDSLLNSTNFNWGDYF
jgi:hypothetical protein